MTTRIAVIGAGVMGADHARIVAEELPGATLQVVCDLDGEAAKAVADALGAADAATEPETVITRSDVDAVIVASPDFTHVPLSLACIEARKKVLCEKPLSQSSAECVRVLEAEQAAGKKYVQLGFMRRYDQSYVEMKDSLNNGIMGRPLMMHNFHRNVETPFSGFTFDMAITSSAPHEYDIIRHVLDTEYAAISTFKPDVGGESIGPVFMVIETTDGQTVSIEINNNADYGYDVRAELVCEKGSIAMNQVAYTRIDAGLKNCTRYDADWRGRYSEAYRRQNRDFLKFVQTGEFPSNAADAWDGYCTAVVGEAGVRALHERQRCPIENMEKPALYS